MDCEVSFNQYCVFKISDVTIYLVYRSPNAPSEAMEGLVNLIKSTKKNTVLIGDFNLPDINWVTGESSRRATNFVEAVEEAMMVQLVEFPTHIKGNCLDLVLTNMPERIMEVREAGRLGSSDHVMMEILVKTGVYNGATKRVNNWRKADWQGMRSNLSKVDWHRELCGKRADRMWETFKRKINTVVKEFVPTRVTTCRGKPVWMSREIMAALKKKKRIWRRDRGRGISEEYREADKKAKSLIRNAKRSFEKKLANA
jgi:hypothetical protein